MEDTVLSQTGRFGKAHLEPPLNSLACRKAGRTLYHVFAGGPDHYNLIHDATMQRCRTDQSGSRLTGIHVQDAEWWKSFSAA